MSILPSNYKEPVTSNYFKFEKGDNIFRILSPVIVGMEYWVANKEGEGRTPVRKRMDEDIVMAELEIDPRTGQLDMPRHFWAMVVWNRNIERVQILEITQKRIRRAIQALEQSKEWGDAREYDIMVTKQGEGFDTEYTVMPSPKKKISKEIMEAYEGMSINLEALFEGTDPFGQDNGEKIAKDVAKEV